MHRRCVDFGWSQINKPRLPQQVEYDLALFRDTIAMADRNPAPEPALKRGGTGSAGQGAVLLPFTSSAI